MISKSKLKNLYEIQGLSYRQIAKKENCCLSTVQYWMKKHGIQPQHQGASIRKTQLHKTFLNKYKRCNVVATNRMRARAQLMVEALIGDVLHPDLCVHHLNGNPNDDRYENLAIANERIHRVNNLHTIDCQGLNEAMYPLARYAGLEKHLVKSEYGYRIDCDFEKIPELQLILLEKAEDWVCAKCRKCKSMFEAYS